jgi:23S rRNA G2445 N2-methylase RlmL
VRTAVRILMRVARFRAEDDVQLYDGVRAVDWSRFLRSDGVLVVDAHTNQSALDHTRFVEQRVKDAVVDQFREHGGGRPSVDREHADLGIYAHLYRDRCTLSVDTSGDALHKRGWRQHQGVAPLAENLAAALVLMSGWNRRAPLLDPFCGTGTVAIEAALIASNTAPGLFREERGFGFERWPDHDARAWRRERELAWGESERPRKLRILGSDASPERIADANDNQDGAGLDGWIEFEPGDALDFAPRKGWNGCIVSNLPYGERVGRGQDVERLYRDFGRILRERCEGYDVTLLCGDERQARALGLANAEVTPLVNGGLECRVVRAHVEG